MFLVNLYERKIALIPQSWTSTSNSNSGRHAWW